MDKYDHKVIEAKWQKRWEKEKIYSPDLKSPKDKFYDEEALASETKNISKKKFYNLWMFPYPSAEGLHAGHAYASTGSDIFGRFMRMQGKTVFQPIGYDSFGIHSENYAIKIGEDPHEVVKRTTKHYEEQMRSLGHGYDWTHTVTTSDPDYYRWTQWLFLKMWEKGLAYKKKAEVNFCPSCKTVLADEQVVTPAQAGKEPKNANGEVVAEEPEMKVCERCGTIVEKKELEQWFFKITDYADSLLDGLEKIDWSERVKVAQRNWIGKSHGMLIKFKVDGEDREIEVFTTRPDTLNAVTFIALADEELYNQKSDEKLGEDTGKFAIDPLSGKKLPIWKTNYVAPGYGTGAIMGVPAHDERDMEFAKKYHLDIVEMASDEALWEKIEKEGWGVRHTNYHLRDWLVSRQRYWGAPIPMIYCEHCAKNNVGDARRGAPTAGDPTVGGFGADERQDPQRMPGWFPVSEKDLPVLLPSISDYKPEGTGKGPLANHEEFWKVKCPKCGGEATRETDVMDTFVDSSWYFLRYPSVGDDNEAFDPGITKNWLPVDLYFGGAEHSVLHLMYSRFVTKVLSDLKLVDFDEPFTKFFAHGLMIKDGAKMSKSRGNVVNPDEYVAKFGADTLRLYEMFLGPMDAYPDFRDTGIEGMQRFVSKLWRIFNNVNDAKISASEVSSKLHQTIKKVTDDLSAFKYNTAIASIMELVNVIEKDKNGISGDAAEALCLILAPFAPHLTEEVWVEILGKRFSIHKAQWPVYDNSLIACDMVNITVQVNGKLRGVINVDSVTANNEDAVIKISKDNGTINKWLEGQSVKKTIFISGKLINFVI